MKKSFSKKPAPSTTTPDSKNITNEKITAKIIELLEKGDIMWRRPWQTSGFVPQNFASRKAYNGINRLMLGSHPFWMTFAQIKEKGGNVIAGSKASPVVYTNFLLLDKDGKKTTDSTKVEKRIPFLKYSLVFNNEQISGIEFPAIEKIVVGEHEKSERAEKIINDLKENANLVLNHGGDRAYYSPSQHKVQMPNIEQFSQIEKYYGVLFHEVAHWTGMDLGRFTLQTAGGFGSASYSREELVAELTTSFICADLQIDLPEMTENSAAYIQSWIKVLKNDTNFILKASKEANKAQDYIYTSQLPKSRKEAENEAKELETV